MDTELSPLTKRHVATLFPSELQHQASQLLVQQCGTNLPFLEKLDAVALERYRFAALKVSDGQIDKLIQAVALAKTDWRDLLVAAGFAHDTKAHESWSPSSKC
jgi:hypothetical protein